LSQLFDRCARDRACASTFPNPRRELKAVLARLDRSPVTVSVAHPRTAQPVAVTLTRNEVEEIIRVMLYTPVDAARLPHVIHRAARGDFAPLIAQYLHSASHTTDDMALGLTMSILCSEDVPSTGEDDGAGSRGGLFGSGYGNAWRSRCRVWPKGPPIGVDREATSAVPALILSGEHDPVTPPASGEAMGRHFPNHVQVVAPGAAHNASFTGCLPDLIARFLENGGWSLDTACVADAPLPPIVLGEAGGRP
jgi:pimeloyl-ACP methyl ester carboxylesterase